MWKNGKFILTERKISSNQLSTYYLEEPLLSRNFCQNSVRYSVEIAEILSHVTLFSQKFRESNGSTFTFCTHHHSVEITGIHSHAFLAKIS